jgi:uncharacterized membrane protein
MNPGGPEIPRMIDPVTDDWRDVLGRLHAVAVYIPAGLLVAVVIAELVAFVQRDHGSRLLRTALWIVTALTAVLAVITGWRLAPGVAGELADRHRILGLALAAVLVLVAIADVTLPRRVRPLATGLRTAGLGAAAGLLVVVGLLGRAGADGPAAVIAATPPPLQGTVAALLRADASAPIAPPTPLASAETLVPAPVAAPPPTPIAAAPRDRELHIHPRLDADAFAALFSADDRSRTLIVTGLPDDPVLSSLLPRCDAVRTVELAGPGIDDAAAATILARTPNARTVLLHESAVTEALLPTLAELPRLEWLSVWGTALDTPATRQRLERDHPGLQVAGAEPPAAAPFGPAMIGRERGPG